MLFRSLCRISGGDFVTTGTTAILRLPDKPTLTMELDHNSHLPCCLGTRSASVLAQGHQINLCVTAASNQNLSTSQRYFYTGISASDTSISLPSSGFYVQTSLARILLFHPPVNVSILNVLRVNMEKPVDAQPSQQNVIMCLRGRMPSRAILYSLVSECHSIISSDRKSVV